MTVVLFEPHHDDAVLFSCYTLLRLKPQVVTVLGWAQVQEEYGIRGETREAENAQAFSGLGLTDWMSWLHSDINPNWQAVRDDMLRYDKTHSPEEVWAPLWEEAGHEQHNAVTDTAIEVFASTPQRLRFYATYRRGSRRTHTENEVTPEPDWPAKKFRAMSAYVSQINLPNCQPWFAADDCLREFIA